jgi:hypothetical protein
MIAIDQFENWNTQHKGRVASSGEYGDEPSGSGATELVSFS